MLRLRTSSQETHSIAAVIFDLDGTLVESKLDFRAIKDYLGCPEEVDLLDFVEQLPPLERQSAINYIQSQELADAEDARWLPWAEKLVENLTLTNLPLAIVTRNFSQAAAIKVESNQIPIKRVVTREDAPPKPNPKALLDLAAEWSINPSEILYVGDFLYDIQAANNANMHSCLYSPDEEQDYAELASISVKCFSELWLHLSNQDNS
ncbi:HAD family hydrolase [Aliikangiella marina]|uniref:HAD family hydrolase n=1 Tax=Aliikangiella marina TaxID=1712262 RepID=A0A545TJ51_9GAMM|nr:HAD-IA family hydrolase [Aliikangiella marina]TQV77259.1 HAD family hydrolase [Aliikangiella marina]